ncbi:MAG: preprotein translocase subunit SecG [Hyphomicrobiaceae bacterium]|nr:preprotein translocase subunit SecG [Hyphomicrobiaceae bacterium]
MQTVLIVIHLLVVLALVGVVLLQRSEGGALGMGGGGGGFMSARGAANTLTRATGILAVAFFTTSLALAIVASQGTKAPSSILDTAAPTAPAKPTGPSVPSASAPPQIGTGQGGILNQLEQPKPAAPQQ